MDKRIKLTLYLAGGINEEALILCIIFCITWQATKTIQKQTGYLRLDHMNHRDPRNFPE